MLVCLFLYDLKVLLELITFRLIPAICPARHANQRIARNDNAFQTGPVLQFSILSAVHSLGTILGSAVILVPTVFKVWI